MLIVGIGASAGGIDAFQKLFPQVPADSGMAFVVVQHLDPERASILPEVLARVARMPVVEVVHGAFAQADQVYVVPPGCVLRMLDGAFSLTHEAARGPIDVFFRSLAEERGEGAVGIVLSGSGNDGTEGLRAIKEHHGLTLAQSPETAGHDSMPKNAIEAHVVDQVLPAERMAAKLLEHAAALARRRRASERPSDEDLAPRVAPICEIVARATGNDFSRYRPGTLFRRIERRMQSLGISSAEEYLERLTKEPEEPARLVKELLIGVTQFFRDPEAFAYLGQNIIPLILVGKHTGQTVRIWVPGCASGEEAYSIAMLVSEHLAGVKEPPAVRIFATDIDEDALAEARERSYPLAIERDVSEQRLHRFFTLEEQRYRPSPALRSMCVFSTHNVVSDPPFTELDLVSCRNVLIYLEPDLQRKVLPRLHDALKPGGFLFLGLAEIPTAAPGLFAPVDGRHHVFRRLELPIGPWIGLPPAAPVVAQPRRIDRPQPRVKSICDGFERLMLQEFTPPGAVVTADGRVLCVVGPTGRYLQPTVGEATNNILDIAHARLRIDLRTALHATVTTGKSVVRDDVRVDLEDGPRRLRLTVRPLAGADLAEQKLYVVVLQEWAGRVEERREAAETAQPVVVEQLESELRTVRADLNTAIEELESSNEELKSSNEELQTTNQELQSSQEELRSVNEELQTVNAELRWRVDELARSNSDLQNFISSTQVAVVFVDEKMRVSRFTAAAARFFHLLDSDINRPIGDLAPRLAGVDLVEAIKQVSRTRAPLERQVELPEQHAWVLLRVQPYRTLQDVVAGGIVTLVDITEVRRAEAAIRREAELQRLATVVRDSNDAITVQNLDGHILAWNRGAVMMYGYSEEEALAMNVDALVPEEGRASARALLEAVRRGEEIRSLEVKRRTKDGRTLDVWLTSTKLVNDEGHPVAVATTERDITDRKRVEADLRRLATVVRDSNDAITVRDLEGHILAWNRGATRMYGYTEKEALAMNVDQLVPPAARAQAHAFLESIKRGEEIASLEVKRRTKDGRTLDVWLTSTKLVDARGRPVAVATTERDITSLRRGRERPGTGASRRRAGRARARGA